MSIFKRRGSEEAERKRRYVALFSDTHGGSDHGLLSPDTKIPKFDEHGEPYYFCPELNRIQNYLYALYSTHVERCADIADDNDLVCEHDGDIAHGTKHPDETRISASTSVQKVIAEAIFKPWIVLPNVKTIRIAEGTQAHDGLGNSMTYDVTAQLQAEYPDKDIKAVQHGLLDIDGYKIDYAHHGPPPGRRSWLKGNEARYYLRDRMMREIIAGRKPPDLYHRAHYHEPVIEWLKVNGFESHLIITPSYSFPGAWTRQATKSINEVVNGMMVLEIEDGKLLNIHELIERTDIRTKERI